LNIVGDTHLRRFMLLRDNTTLGARMWFREDPYEFLEEKVPKAQADDATPAEEPASPEG